MVVTMNADVLSQKSFARLKCSIPEHRAPRHPRFNRGSLDASNLLRKLPPVEHNLPPTWTPLKGHEIAQRGSVAIA